MKGQKYLDLLERLQQTVSFHDLVKARLEEILAMPVEVRQPKSMKGVYKLLCAIHTYKI